MKIAIIVSSLNSSGGMSKYIYSLTTLLLQDQQNTIYIITTHNKVYDYEQQILLNINANIKYYGLGRNHKFNKYINLIRILRQVSADIIINNYNAICQYIIPFINKSSKIIHVIHNDTNDFYRIASINGKHVTGWIAPTAGIADKFNRYTNFKYTHRISVIPHGVEEVSPFPDKPQNKPKELVFIGVLYEHKGVKILPQIIKTLYQKGENFHFTIIGDGILRHWLEEEINDFIKNKIVELTGVIPHNSVYQILAKADIFVYPTHVDAFGLVIAEAMMNGVVPIVTRLDGITDNLISDKRNGYLMPMDDIHKFVATIHTLIKNSKLLTDLQMSAYNSAKEKFSIKTMSHNYKKYLSDIVKDK